jgi:putative tricarboxylic transport membrane protein
METLNSLLTGFEIILTWKYLLWCFTGVLLGTLIGLLPGLGSIATIAILLPMAISLGDPTGTLVMMAGIYYGAQYGGSTTSILLNIPGETSSMITALDGYKMSQKGKAGSALTVSALGSFVGGIIGTVFVCFLATPMINSALLFGPIEYTSLMIMCLLGSVFISRNSVVVGVGMVCIGMLFAMIGADVNSGTHRLTFGQTFLLDGITFAIMVMGLFGLSEVLHVLLQNRNSAIKNNKKFFYFDTKDIKQSIAPCFRGTIIGSILGVLPGGGTWISAMSSYMIEKKISKTPEKFGTGMVQGVAGPESANNAAAQTSFIPLLTLGVPFQPIMAMMLSVMLMSDITPGPQLMTDHPNIFWALIASFCIGNIMLLFLNLPLIGLWVKLINLPKVLLYSAIVFFCILGAYKINNNWQEVVYILLFFTALGYFLKKIDCDPSPLLLGFVIGGHLEEYLRRSLLLHDGNFLLFLERPISFFFIIVSVIMLGCSVWYKSNNNQSGFLKE